MNVDQFLHNLWANSETYSEVVAGYKSPKRGIAQIAKMSGFTKTLPATGTIDEDFLEDLFAYICPMKEAEGEDFGPDDDPRGLTDLTSDQRNAMKELAAFEKMKTLAEEEKAKVIAPIEHYEEWATW